MQVKSCFTFDTSVFRVFFSRNQLQILQLSTLTPVLGCHCVIESGDKLYFCFFMGLLSYLSNFQKVRRGQYFLNEQKLKPCKDNYLFEGWMILGFVVFPPRHHSRKKQICLGIYNGIETSEYLYKILWFSFPTDYPKSFCWIHNKPWSSKCGIKQVGFVVWCWEEPFLHPVPWVTSV